MRYLGAVLAAAVVLGGCSAASGGGGVASDAPLDVYLSLPLSGPGAAAGKQIEADARKALAAAGGKAGGHPIALTVLDATGGDGVVDPASVGANARIATEDADTIAYLGETTAAASETSVPITDGAQIPQIVLGPAPEGLDVDNLVALPAGSANPGTAAIELLLPAIERAEGEGTTRKAVRDELHAGG